MDRSSVAVDDVAPLSFFHACENGKTPVSFKYKNGSRAVRFAPFPNSEQLVGRVVFTTGNEKRSESDHDA